MFSGKLAMAVACFTSVVAQAGKAIVPFGGGITSENKAKMEVLPLHPTVARDIANSHHIPYGEVQMNVPGKEKRKSKRKQSRASRKRNR